MVSAAHDPPDLPRDQVAQGSLPSLLNNGVTSLLMELLDVTLAPTDHQQDNMGLSC